MYSANVQSGQYDSRKREKFMRERSVIVGVCVNLEQVDKLPPTPAMYAGPRRQIRGNHRRSPPHMRAQVRTFASKKSLPRCFPSTLMKRSKPPN